MTHDPLCSCTNPLQPVSECDCDLIARVVERERGNLYTDAEVEEYNQKHFDKGRHVGYAAALRDAVEAVRSVSPDAREWMQRAVAAIEALGGER